MVYINIALFKFRVKESPLSMLLSSEFYECAMVYETILKNLCCTKGSEFFSQ